MKLDNDNSYSFDVFYFIKLVWSWKISIITICALAGILTYIFTGPSFIEPKYKADVIFYPTTNANLSTTILTEPGNQGYGLLEFGTDEDAEQLLQILKSDEMRNNVIIKYELAAHYGLDTSKQVSMLGLRTMLSKNLEIKQTEFKAIQVTVFDKDPQLAADMANYIANYADFQKNAIQKTKAKEALSIIEGEYQKEVALMDSINDQLMKLRNLGIYDYFEQFSQLNEAYTLNSIRLDQEEALLKVYEQNKNSLPDTLIIKTKARVQGYRAAVNSLKPTLDKIKQHGGTYINNIDNLELERKKLQSLKSRYESAKMEFESALPQKFIINAAEKPEIPAKPRRILSSAMVSISTFFFALLVIALIDLFPFLRKKLS
jgi:uncharacterized protein involved in exopolysaccharide biosynthesis